MKKPLLYIVFFFASVFGYAQNLVPNPSFELFSECPDTSSLGISAASDWYNPTGYSPDYFNSCDVRLFYSHGVPQNWYGYQTAKTGVAYAGTIAKYGSGDQREYIQAKLTDTLQVGKNYLVSFFVALADSSPYAVNNIGAYFSSAPVLSSNSNPLPYLPQISNNPQTNPLNLPNTWIEVIDTLIAMGDEKYITIGNFNNDSSTDTTHIHNYSPTHENSSYHYIDDVSVTCLDCTVGIKETLFKSLSIYPNPTSDIINIDFNNSLAEKITLLNSFGNFMTTVSRSEFSNRNSFQLDVSRLPNGVYFIKIETKQEYITKSIIIKK